MPLLLAASFAAFAQQPAPRMTSVDPMNGRVGDEITVSGENLEKAQVAKVYLTDGKNDVLLELTEQSATTVKFKIPAKAQAGRFALMLLTTGKEPKLIEQPVKLTVEQ
ncbi:MAG TPA: IPT/TIG domain-containing protein [Bryobacteraceae bacterium]|nr:IPT/TIG domain-containing protein [Bryobacteraceae bacterium]